MVNFLYDYVWLHLLGGIAWYLPLAAFAYYAMYSNAVDFNFRLNVPYQKDASAWQDFVSHEKGVLKLLALDFLKIHCPWSKKTSIQYRVQVAHDLLQHKTHEKGWRAEDCHDPANHIQIAKDCFQPRTRFWAEQIFLMLTAPLRIFLLFIIVIIVTIAYLIMDVVSFVRGMVNSYSQPGR